MSLYPLARSAANRLGVTVNSRKLNRLNDVTLQSFIDQAFVPEIPIKLSRELFAVPPATYKWFDNSEALRPRLDTDYLENFGNLLVPLEITSSGPRGEEFTRVERPLSEFLSFLEAKQIISNPHDEVNGSKALQIYLAQYSMSSLPEELLEDLPTPNVVSKAGRGDIYDSSIWIGLAPTYTPLHKDPNPNLFLQLAGQKVVRIFEPRIGAELYAGAQRIIGKHGSASLRGEEMMQGDEKRVLEDLVWNSSGHGNQQMSQKTSIVAYEATLGAGDAVFIPKGWWHSIKGIGHGIVGSANWWFR